MLTEPAQWRDAVAQALAAGYSCYDQLLGIDDIGRSDTLRVQLRLVHPGTRAELMLECRLDRSAPVIDSISDLIAGAAWGQRQVRDFFGVTFTGGDNRPLLNHGGGAPLLKDAVLGARVVTAWPGALEPGETTAAPSRRRMAPPGVPDPAVWGDRDPTVGAPDPAEVAASAVGGRVRRRR